MLFLSLLLLKSYECLSLRRDGSNWPAYHILEGKTASHSGSGFTHALEGKSLTEKALEYAKKMMGTQDVPIVTSSYIDSTSNMYHMYLKNSVNGKEIENSVASVHMDLNGNLRYSTANWLKIDNQTIARLSKREPEISCLRAFKSVAKKMLMPIRTSMLSLAEGDVNQIVGSPADRAECVSKYYITSKGQLRPVHSITMHYQTQYLNVQVDMETGKILGASDWVSGMKFDSLGRLVKRQQTFMYNVVPLGAFDLKTNQQRLVIDPANPTASPMGWHNKGNGSQGTTDGNNVIATENSPNVADVQQLIQTGKRSRANDFNFNFVADDTNQTPDQYQDASITQAFYAANIFHDIMYLYGFDEAAGNFQVNNLSGQGKGNDPVLAIVQDGSGKNNANFATPPDGSPGIMRMFVFDVIKPNRDGAMENAVIYHELTHGLSTRLTGGPNAGNCLSTLESGGLGEGWSDAFALFLEMNDGNDRNTERAIGQYVVNDSTKGVRKYPYSTSLTSNPSMFSDIPKVKQEHAIGEVWASMLYEVYWNLVDAKGFDPNFKTNPNGGKGNNLMFQLMIMGMKLQPCNPTMIQARDAIIKADQMLNNGSNVCAIAKGFAKRGLGMNADGTNYINDSTLPQGCQ